MISIGTVGEETAQATALLTRAGVDTPQLDAEVLMAHAINSTRVYAISHTERVLTDEESKRFHDMIIRRAEREPLAYIIGEREFWGLNFDITPGILVPRPETEILVEVALSQLRDVPNPLIADIGAGSGCVCVALAVELLDAVVYATELDPAAAELTRRNAIRHQVEIRVDILVGDLLDPLPGEVHGRLDAVVSNPPYIPSAQFDHLQPEIKDYEPRGALDGGPDGMVYHRKILTAAWDWLKPGGWVDLEIGAEQAEAITAYAIERGYQETSITNDLADLPRVLSARRPDVESRMPRMITNNTNVCSWESRAYIY